MGWARSTYGERINAYAVLVRNPEGKRQLEDTGVDERITLRWIFRMWDGAWTGLISVQNTDSCMALVNAVKIFRVS